MLPSPPRATLFPYTTLFRSLASSYGQSSLNRVSNDTGGKAFFQGTTGFVTFDSYFSRLTQELNRVYAIASDRKSTRLNSSHVAISYAVFCLKKKIKLI